MKVHSKRSITIALQTTVALEGIKYYCVTNTIAFKWIKYYCIAKYVKRNQILLSYELYTSESNGLKDIVLYLVLYTCIANMLRDFMFMAQTVTWAV